MMNCPGRIGNFEFSPDDIERAVNSDSLLSLEIEFSLMCNFRCPYCYVPDKSVLDSEMTREEIRDVILQAKDLGAGRIIILGGEPTIYPHITEMISFIQSHDLEVEIFTNGSVINADFAKWLFDRNVRIVLKMNSFNPDVQDRLTGVNGSFTLIENAFRNLREAGYPSKDGFLAVSTIICKQNIDELAQFWQWLRDQNVAPYFEILTPQGCAKQNAWLMVDPERLHDLFREVATIDRKRYGHVWEPQPPLLGNRCLRHRFSCLVNSQGFVMPCVGVNLPLGNIREQSLRCIIENSEVIQDLRDYSNTIKGPCRSCEKGLHCYGCRGTAYQLTGDYLASDPTCWQNIDRQAEIARLPISVEGLIPQKGPMNIIETLVNIGEKTAEVETTISEGMPIVDENGVLDGAAYMELMAQAVAAMNGFRKLGNVGCDEEGYLIGASKLEVLGLAQIGDTLRIVVNKYARYGEFSMVNGTVSRNGKVLARGEIKVWSPTGQNGDPGRLKK